MSNDEMSNDLWRKSIIQAPNESAKFPPFLRECSGPPSFRLVHLSEKSARALVEIYRERFPSLAGHWRQFAVSTSDLRAGQCVRVLRQQGVDVSVTVEHVTHVDHVWGYVRIDTHEHGPIDVPLDALDVDSNGVFYRMPAL